MSEKEKLRDWSIQSWGDPVSSPEATGLYAVVGGRFIDLTPQDDYPIFEWQEPAPVPSWKSRVVRAVAWVLRIELEARAL